MCYTDDPLYRGCLCHYLLPPCCLWARFVDLHNLRRTISVLNFCVNHTVVHYTFSYISVLTFSHFHAFMHSPNTRLYVENAISRWTPCRYILTSCALPSSVSSSTRTKDLPTHVLHFCLCG